MDAKEKLRQEFNRKFTYEAGDGWRMESRAGTPDKVFDFFYAEIEARQENYDFLHGEHSRRMGKLEEELSAREEDLLKAREIQVEGFKEARINYEKYEKKISHLEELLKAADEVIKELKIVAEYYGGELGESSEDVLEKYQTLKNKQ